MSRGLAERSSDIQARWNDLNQPVVVVWAAIVGLLILTVSTQRATIMSDPRGTMMVSQMLVQHGTIKLDGLGEPLLTSLGYLVREHGGHVYHYFPVGSAFIAAPFVAVANGLGVDMRESDATMQLVLVVLGALVTLGVLYRTARLYLGAMASTLLAGLSWFGTSYASTLSTALWSHNLAVLFASLAIYLSLRVSRAEYSRYFPALIGVCLFLAYVCRPTMALLVPAVLVFVLLYSWRAALYAALTSGVLMTVFIAWSLREFSMLLPAYYQSGRLGGSEQWIASYANLLSPSRGLFIFSPFLAVVLLLPYLIWTKRRKELPLIIIALAWPAAHLLAISRFPQWWGGGSYGPRLMVDALPGLLLGTFVTVAVLARADASRHMTYAAVAILGVFSIFVNTYQGLYDKSAATDWNISANPDLHPTEVLNWQYPQFLHDERRQQERTDTLRQLIVPPFTERVTLRFDSPKLRFEGFDNPEGGGRWIDGHRAALSFELPAGQLTGGIRIRGFFLDTQRVVVELNGRTILNDSYQPEFKDLVAMPPPAAFRAGTNTLTFELPDAHPQEPGGKVRGMSFVELAIG